MTDKIRNAKNAFDTVLEQPKPRTKPEQEPKKYDSSEVLRALSGRLINEDLFNKIVSISKSVDTKKFTDVATLDYRHYSGESACTTLPGYNIDTPNPTPEERYLLREYESCLAMTAPNIDVATAKTYEVGRKSGNGNFVLSSVTFARGHYKKGSDFSYVVYDVQINEPVFNEKGKQISKDGEWQSCQVSVSKGSEDDKYGPGNSITNTHYDNSFLAVDCEVVTKKAIMPIRNVDWSGRATEVVDGILSILSEE